MRRSALVDSKAANWIRSVDLFKRRAFPYSAYSDTAWIWTVALSLVLVLATTAIYARVIHHQFVDYDDDVYVVQNPHVNTGFTWANIRWALTADAVSNWHPITWISHILDCQLYGLSYPGGHHASSLILHVFNVVLIFLLLSRATGAVGCSFIAAGLLALHPFNVESVAWVAERKNVLCTFFFLLALGAYGWYARKPSAARYACVAGLFVLALASKPMVITLPFVLLLLDFWPLGRVQKWSTASPAFPVARAPFLRLVVEKLPLIGLSAASAVITVVVQRRGHQIVSFSDSGIGWRLENAIWAYATYLWITFLPWRLAPFYPTMQLPVWRVAASGCFLLAVAWLVWRFGPGRPYLFVGWLWFVGTLVPVIGIIQIGAQSMADRYAYIPLIGIFVAAVWGIRGVRLPVLGDYGTAALAAVILISFSLATYFQVGYWQDSVSLWRHALDATVDNFVAEEDLAVGLANQGRDDEAFPHFIAARSIRPFDTIANFNIAINLEQHGRHEDAVLQFEQLIRSQPDLEHMFEAHRRVAAIYDEVGDFEKARSHLVEAIHLKPEDTTVFRDLASLESKVAAENLSQSILAHPTAQGYYELGQFLEQDGRTHDAHAAYSQALHLDPNFLDAKRAMDNLKVDPK